jgi:hypothetical protein
MPQLCHYTSGHGLTGSSKNPIDLGFQYSSPQRRCDTTFCRGGCDLRSDSPSICRRSDACRARVSGMRSFVAAARFKWRAGTFDRGPESLGHTDGQ